MQGSAAFYHYAFNDDGELVADINYSDGEAMLDDDDELALFAIEQLASKYRKLADGLAEVVRKCMDANSTEGLTEMVAMQFNAQQYKPQYGGGGGLPPGKYKGVIVESSQENVEKNGQVVGGYLQFMLTPIEGPHKDQKQADRLNLHNSNPKVVAIANGQLAAYCAVLNKPMFNNTEELHNIPFMFDVGYQKGQEPIPEKPEGGYTEIKAIYDINGNDPANAGRGPQQVQGGQQAQPVAPPPAGVGPAPGQGGWGGQPGSPGPQGGPAIDSGVQMPGQQPQGAPGAGWGQPSAGQPSGGAPAQGGWGQQGGQAPQQQPQGGQAGAWGQPTGGQQGGGWGAR